MRAPLSLGQLSSEGLEGILGPVGSSLVSPGLDIAFKARPLQEPARQPPRLSCPSSSTMRAPLSLGQLSCEGLEGILGPFGSSLVSPGLHNACKASCLHCVQI